MLVPIRNSCSVEEGTAEEGVGNGDSGGTEGGRVNTNSSVPSDQTNTNQTTETLAHDVLVPHHAR